jgi:acyl-CoA thioesterase
VDEIKDFITERDRFAQLCGIELLEVAPGRSRARMALTPAHLNGVGSVHGGAIFTLADLAFAAASNSHGTVAVAINVSISYTKAAVAGTLTAQAEEVARHPKIASYTVRVTDDSGDLVAIFQGMVYRKREPLTEVAAG